MIDFFKCELTKEKLKYLNNSCAGSFHQLVGHVLDFRANENRFSGNETGFAEVNRH